MAAVVSAMDAKTMGPAAPPELSHTNDHDEVPALLTAFEEWKQLKAPLSPERVKRWLATPEDAPTAATNKEAGAEKSAWVALPSCLLKPSDFSAQLQSALDQQQWCHLARWPLRKADVRVLLPLCLDHQQSQEQRPAFECAYPYCWTPALQASVRAAVPSATLLRIAEAEAQQRDGAHARSHKALRKEKKRHTVPAAADEAAHDTKAALVAAISAQLATPAELVELIVSAYATELHATVAPLQEHDDPNEDDATEAGTPVLRVALPKKGQPKAALCEKTFHHLWLRLHLTEDGIGNQPDVGLRALLRSVWCKEEGPAFVNAFLSVLLFHLADDDNVDEIIGEVDEIDLSQRKEVLRRLPATWQTVLRDLQEMLHGAPPSLLRLSAMCRSPFAGAKPDPSTAALAALLQPATPHDKQAMFRHCCKESVQRLTVGAEEAEVNVTCPPPLLVLQETLRAMLATVSAHHATAAAAASACGYFPMHRKSIEATLGALQRHFTADVVGATIVSMAHVAHPSATTEAKRIEEAEQKRRFEKEEEEMEDHHRVDKNGAKGEGKRISKSVHRKAKEVEKGRKKKEKSRQKHGGHRGPLQASPTKAYTLTGASEDIDDHEEEEDEEQGQDGEGNGDEEEDEANGTTEELLCHNPNRSPTTDFYDFEGRLGRHDDDKHKQKKTKKMSYRKQAMAPEEAVQACRQLWTLYGDFCQNGGVWPFATLNGDEALSPVKSKRLDGRRRSSSTSTSSSASLEPLIGATTKVTAIGVGLLLQLLGRSPSA